MKTRVNLEEIKKSFEENLYSIQKETDHYIILQKPSALIGEVYDNNKSEYIIWNKNQEYKSYHSHAKSFKTALDIVAYAEQGKLFPPYKTYEIESTLRVLDLNNPLWSKYIDLIMSGKCYIHNIKKYFNGKEMEITFNVWYPCPKCGKIETDFIEEINARCCRHCGKVFNE